MRSTLIPTDGTLHQSKPKTISSRIQKKKVTPEKSKNNIQTNTATKTKHNRIKQQIDVPPIAKNYFENRTKENKYLIKPTNTHK